MLKATGKATKKRVAIAFVSQLINAGNVHRVDGAIAASAPESSPKQTAPGIHPLLKYFLNDLLSRMLGV